MNWLTHTFLGLLAQLSDAPSDLCPHKYKFLSTLKEDDQLVHPKIVDKKKYQRFAKPVYECKEHKNIILVISAWQIRRMRSANCEWFGQFQIEMVTCTRHRIKKVEVRFTLPFPASVENSLCLLTWHHRSGTRGRRYGFCFIRRYPLSPNQTKAISKVWVELQRGKPCTVDTIFWYLNIIQIPFWIFFG